MVDIPTTTGIKHALELCAVPSLVMALSSWALLFIVGCCVTSGPESLTNSRAFQQCLFALQHVGAGIIVSAVAVELVPRLLHSSNSPSTLCGISLGFFAGVSVMIMFEAFCETDDDDEEDGDEEGEGEGEGEEESEGGGVDTASISSKSQASGAGYSEFKERQRRQFDGFEEQILHGQRRFGTLDQMLLTTTLLEAGEAANAGSSADPFSRQRRSPLCSGESSPRKSQSRHHKRSRKQHGSAGRGMALTLILAVSIDGFIDGLLIGISSFAAGGEQGAGTDSSSSSSSPPSPPPSSSSSSSSSSSAGLVMTVALTIEMCFLGLSFAAALQRSAWSTASRAAFCALPPAMLLAGGLVGAAGAEALAEQEAASAGLISFGVAALLYLVTEELLLEAHKRTSTNTGAHVWWCVTCSAIPSRSVWPVPPVPFYLIPFHSTLSALTLALRLFLFPTQPCRAHTRNGVHTVHAQD